MLATVAIDLTMSRNVDEARYIQVLEDEVSATCCMKHAFAFGFDDDDARSEAERRISPSSRRKEHPIGED